MSTLPDGVTDRDTERPGPCIGCTAEMARGRVVHALYNELQMSNDEANAKAWDLILDYGPRERDWGEKCELHRRD